MAVLFRVAALFFVFTRQSPSAESEMTNGTSLMADSAVERAIELSGSYLERACQESGEFVYSINIDSGETSTDYNMVRHAGAIYALAMLNELHPDEKAAATMAKASHFMQGFIDQPSGDATRQQTLAIWSNPYEASLGATSLGLVALLDLQRVKPEPDSKQEFEALARFAVSLQRDDGGFYSLYNLHAGPEKQVESLYYPGETALGLVSLYELDHTNEWLTAAGKALAYLCKSHSEAPNTPTEHWTLIATAKFLPYFDASHCPVSRAELLRHADQICEGFLAEQITNASQPELAGGFDKNGRTTPTAARLEGLQAALEFIPSNQSELRSRIETAVQRGVDFLLRAQIKSGWYAGGMPGMVMGNDSDARTIRIDYVQHALCAWIRYEKFLAARAKTKAEQVVNGN